LVEAHRILQRIARFVSAQAESGKRVRFVVEPYLRKHSDFSCQFRIEDDGRVAVISVQKLDNNGLAFGASHSAGPEFLRRLESERYFELITRTGTLLYADGYRGDVCVDSMILENGELAPLVEINARKSMSLIKNAIDHRLKKMHQLVCLTYVSAVNNHTTDFPGLLDLLERDGLLFSTGCDMGILPLTCGTMYSALSSDLEKPVRGRLYVATIFEKPEHQPSLMAALVRVMERAGLRGVL
jgi:hypothetical protein